MTSLGFTLLTASILLAALFVTVTREQGKTLQALGQAERNFERARKIVEDYFIQVSEEALLNEPGMQPLRKKLLGLALDYHRQFLEDVKNSRRQADVAQSYFRVASIEDDLGETAEALESYRRGKDQFEELLRHDGRSLEYRIRVAECWERIGALADELGQGSRASDAIDRALAQFQVLKVEQPASDRVWSGLSNCLYTQGRRNHRSRRFAEAQEVQEEAIRLVEEIVARNPSSVRFRLMLAFYCHNFSTLLADRGRSPMPMLVRAKAQLEELQKENPSSYKLRYELAKVMIRMGMFHVRVARREETLRELEQARALLEPLVEGNPRVQAYRRDLAATYELLASNSRSIAGGGPLSAKDREYMEKAYTHSAALYRENPSDGRNMKRYGHSCEELGEDYLLGGNSAEAVSWLQRAHEMMTKTLAMYPEDPFSRGELANDCLLFGSALARTGQHEKAAAVYRQGIDHFGRLFPHGSESHGISWFEKSYEGLIESLLLLGRPDETIQAIAEYHRGVAGQGRGLYNVACYFARCVPMMGTPVLREARAAEAIKTLRQAAASGWSDAWLMARDPDLRRCVTVTSSAGSRPSSWTVVSRRIPWRPARADGLDNGTGAECREVTK